MTSRKGRFLAVIDPTRVEQWALQKAVSMAKGRDDSTVYAFLCTWSEKECGDRDQLKAAEVRRNTIWLDEIVARFESEGVNMQTFVGWNEDWRDAVGEFARENKIDLVVKRASGRQDSLASSDRQLIRSLKSALLLVKHDPSKEVAKVLVAVDFNATDESHTELNEAIIELGRRIRGDNANIELHSVSAYPDSDKFVHAPDVARKLGIERAQAHVRRGSAQDVIPLFANEIDADLVIVGSVGRRGLSGIAVGNTAEKILTDIRSDVMVLVREAKESRSASAA